MPNQPILKKPAIKLHKATTAATVIWDVLEQLTDDRQAEDWAMVDAVIELLKMTQSNTKTTT